MRASELSLEQLQSFFDPKWLRPHAPTTTGNAYEIRVWKFRTSLGFALPFLAYRVKRIVLLGFQCVRVRWRDWLAFYVLVLVFAHWDSLGGAMGGIVGLSALLLLHGCKYMRKGCFQKTRARVNHSRCVVSYAYIFFLFSRGSMWWWLYIWLRSFLRHVFPVNVIL